MVLWIKGGKSFFFFGVQGKWSSNRVEKSEKEEALPKNYGNQPQHAGSISFNYADHPWLTQYGLEKVIEKGI